jgi:UDP-3-O-[3-hydroxymyristoyl] N-acetylglucosamine deacetylase
VRDVEGMDRQHTLSGHASRSGVGVHSGAPARLTLHGAEAGGGVVFRRTDVSPEAGRIEALRRNVRGTQLGTNITNAHGVSVATVEHLLAALMGMGVDNVIAELDGPELPILDGSAKVFCEMIAEAGVVPQSAPRRRLVVLQPVEVRDGVRFARLFPGDGFSIDATIDFASPAIGRQHLVWTSGPGGFEREIAFARTFGMAEELAQLQSIGKGRGASLANTIGVEDGRILNPEGLRAPDEFVRHKILDIIGDLALAGAPIEGRFEGSQMGHALNAGVLDQLLSSPGAAAWRVEGRLEPLSP